MALRNVSLKIAASLEAKIVAVAVDRRMGKSALLREAIESYLSRPGPRGVGTFGDLARDLKGRVAAAPDLSTNPKHLSGYGR